MKKKTEKKQKHYEGQKRRMKGKRGKMQKGRKECVFLWTGGELRPDRKQEVMRCRATPGSDAQELEVLEVLRLQ